MHNNDATLYGIGYNNYLNKENCIIGGYSRKEWQKGWNAACEDHNEAILWLNDKIIDYGSLSLVTKFFDHLVKATQDPQGFLFDGAGGKFNAQEWLEFHANRLKMHMQGRLILRSRYSTKVHIIIPEDVCYYV